MSGVLGEIRNRRSSIWPALLAIGIEHTVFAVWDRRLRVGAQATGVRLAPAD